MGTFWHILRKNALVRLPSRLIFYDCETREETFAEGLQKHVLKLGIATYVSRHTKGFRWQEDTIKFTQKEKFWDWVETKVEIKIRLLLIAHQQHFDFMVVDGFNQLTKRGWELTMHIITSNLFLARFRKEKCTIMIVDSLNWFKASIKGLGEALGKPKGEIDFDTCSLAELEAYCRQDVAILKDTVLELFRFIRSYNLGNFQLTRASQAFCAFKHRFMPFKVWIHADRLTHLLERASYRGGRNECFYLGQLLERVFDLDVNSLYPFVMQINEYPTKLLKYYKKATVAILQEALKEYCVIARVKIHIDEPFIALKEERLLFPIGSFEVTLTTPELLRVLEKGQILKVYELATYEKALIFQKWVTELYKLRLGFKTESNRVFEEFAKGMLNSLYGKFGQRVEDTKQVDTAPIDKIAVERIICHETKEVWTEVTFAGEVHKRIRGRKEFRDSFPAIASHVTAYARLYLHDLIQLAGIANCFYCDTDSLFVNQKGLDRLKHLLDETKLGCLKLEGIANSVEIRGCKDYRLGSVEKIKGIKKDAVKLGENLYEQIKFYKFRSLLRKGVLDAPLTEIITKELKREYLKGIIGDNGRVTPFVLS